MERQVVIKHGENGKDGKTIQLINPPKRNEMEFARRHFKKSERELAVAQHVESKKNIDKYNAGRNEILYKLACVKKTPNMNFKITLENPIVIIK